MSRLRNLPAILSLALAVCHLTESAFAGIIHTITSASDVAVTASGYTADGTLDLTLGYAPTPGTNLTVVKNTGTTFIAGSFTNVGQGATVPLTFNGITYNYIANYYGGNGRSLVLQWPLIRMAAWGANSSGQLGDNSQVYPNSPVEVITSGAMAGKTVIAAAAGSDHSLALTSDGLIFAWGSNYYGQLGKSGITGSNEPVAVDTSGALAGKTVVAIEAGGSMSLALTSDGQVFSWGFNSSGQLGNNSTTSSPIPVAVDTSGVLAAKTVVGITCGNSHCLALTSAGKVVGWGYNFHGQLGNNSITNSPVPVEVVSSGVLNGKTVVAITAGSNHSVAATSDGLAYAWGINSLGELGNNSTSPSPMPVAVNTTGALAGKSVVSVSAGYSQTLALTSEGQVVAWGPNGSSGVLGNNSTVNSLVPVNSSGSLAGETVVSIATGYSHGLALTADGQTHIWGSNGYRQLGNQGDIDTPVLAPVSMPSLGPLAGKTVPAIAAGTHHSFAMFDAGPPILRVNPVDKLANSGTPVSFTAAAEHPFPTSVQWQVSASGLGGPFTNIPGNPSALTGTLSLPAVDPSQSGHAYRAVFTNISGTCTTTAATLTVTTWETTFTSGTQIPFQADSVAVSGTLSLQLGFVPAPGTHLTVIQNRGPAFISGAFDNIPQGGVVPLTYNGITYQYVANYYGGNGRSLVLQWPCMNVAGWGSNYSKILGDIGSNDQPIPVTVPTEGPLAGKTLVAISSVGGHVLALTSDGKVFAWGSNSNGQLGNNSTLSSPLPVAVSASGDLANKTVVAVAAGGSHSLALTSEGRIYTWGSARLGYGSSVNYLTPVALSPTGALSGKTVVAISAGGTHDLALTSDGEIFAWGENGYGQLGDLTTQYRVDPVRVGKGEIGTATVAAIAAGSRHNLALSLEGKVFAWGAASDGAIGNNSVPTTFNSPLPTAVTADGALSGKTLVAIAATDSRSMALSSDGNVFTWGRNWVGELGNNTTLPSRVPVAVNTSGVLAGKSIVAMSAGTNHSMALTTDGLVFSWGENGNTQLGNGDWNDSPVPVAVNTSTSVLAGTKATSILAGWNSSLAMYGAGPPTLTRHPLDQMAAAGSTVTFSAAATDRFAFSVRWQVSETGSAGPFSDITGNSTATTENLVLSDITPAHHGSAYRAVFTSAAGISETNAASLAVVSWSATFLSATDVPFQSERASVAGPLSLELGFAPPPGTSLTVLEITGPAFIGGTFDNIPQGGVITLSYNGVTYDFVANYYGGNGRSLVLHWPWTKLAAWGSNSSGQFANGNTTSSTSPVAADAKALLAESVLASTSVGTHHNLALTVNGRVFAWGANSSGQLGVGNTTTSQVAIPVVDSGVLSGKSVIALAAGDMHSLALTSEGKVYSWGSNISRQLGNNSSATSSVPVAVDSSGVLNGRTIISIAAGDDHSLALDSEGRVFSWGDNSWYQLGNNGWQDSAIPVAVESAGALLGKTVVSIAAGERHSVALTSEGEVFTWGTNTNGQLGDNSTTDSRVPVKVHTGGSLAGKNVVAIAAGASHTMALTSDGRVVAWGFNSDGQLGDGSTSASSVPVEVLTDGVLAGKSAVAISAGAFHSMALTSEGQVVAWGYNFSGQLGNTATASSPVPVATNTSGVLSARKVTALSAGTSHSLVMYAGIGGPTVVRNPSDRVVILGSSPADVSLGFTAGAVDVFPFSIQWQVSQSGINGPFSDITGNPSATTATLGLTGINSSNDHYAYRAVFSNNGGAATSIPAVLTMLSAASPVNFPAAGYIPFTAVSPTVGGLLDINLGFAPPPGTRLTIIQNTGLGFITGQFSNLPPGATVPLTFGGVTHDFVVNYFGGNGRSLVLQWASTRLAAWGSSSSGQLGHNSTGNSSVPVTTDSSGVLAGKSVSTVTAGFSYSLALTTEGRILSWGINGLGQLGNNSTTNSSVPVEVDATGALAGKTVVSVSAGGGHSLALASDGQVFAWGSNGSGRLGNGDTTNSPVPVAVSANGVLNGKTVTAIAAGGSHSLALTSEGKIYAWGLNTAGQLGNNSTATSTVPVEVVSDGVLMGKSVIAIAAGSSHSMALTSDGRVFTWGSNQYGQLGKSSGTSSNVPVATGLIGGGSVAIAAGSNHCLSLTSDGSVYAWGLGTSGQLGNGGFFNSSTPTAVSTSGLVSGKSVTLIAAGSNHSLAVASDGMAYAWGSNNSGQLGNNSLSASSTPVPITTASGAVGSRMVVAIAGGGSHSLALCGVGRAPVLGVSPENRTIPVNGTATFTATADGGYPSATVRWQQSPTGAGGTFTNITGNATATTGTLVLTNVSVSRNGYAYRAVFTNSEASVNSTPATLTVIPPPTISVPANIAQDATGTAGSVVEFSVTASDALDGPLTPTCSPPAGTLFPIGTTTVNCSVINSLGQTSTASFTVTVRKSYAWFIDQHDLTDSDPLADPNSTGINNLTAYAFGMDPAAPDRTQLPSISIENGELRISYTRWKDAAALNYLVEVSDDNQLWNSGLGHTQQVSVASLDANRERVVERDLTPVAGSSHRFIRIRIVK